MTLRIAVTAGEPAGIGPELMYALSRHILPGIKTVVIASKELLQERFASLKLQVQLKDYDKDDDSPDTEGTLTVLSLPLAVPSVAGTPDVRNAGYVLHSLDRAHEGLMTGEFAALVTGPVSKGIIADSGLEFTGHTEYLQHKCGVHKVVMLLGCPKMKVALATTHLPLRAVADAITKPLLEEIITILNHDLQEKFGIAKPHIFVSGLNPHAGEDGHLGTEEKDTIIPVLESMRSRGYNLTGPLPADTMFQPKYLQEASAFLCMYHDQGLPVLKYAGFEEGYNTTLGLPYIRTSVDHGTAFDLAGKGLADPASLLCAMKLAADMAHNVRNFRSAQQAAAQATAK